MGTSVLSTGFARVAGALHAEGVPLARVAEEVGTPAYVYSAEVIRTQYAALATALEVEGVPHRIHYSVKANGCLALLSLLRSQGAGADVVSGGELFLARQAGFGGQDIVFGGVGKTPQEIAEAIDAGVKLINAESAAEVAIINTVAQKRGKVAPIGLRVNPEVTVDTPHAYTRTGERGTKFGISIDDALTVIRETRGQPHVRLVALDMHIGSQISDIAPYERALDRLTSLIAQIRAEGLGAHLAYLDAGGGLGVSYNDEAGMHVNAFAHVVGRAATRTGLTLLIEPGRYIVGNAGVMLTRVLYRKQSGNKTYVITDAGMTELLRPSHYQAYHQIERVAAPASDGARRVVDVVGPVCESGDFFALDRELEEVEVGEVLAIRSAGAYGFAMASNYNARLRPPEVLVDGDQYTVVRTRETYDDLVRHETGASHHKGKV